MQTFLCTNGKSGQDEGDKSGQRMREAGAPDRGSALCCSGNQNQTGIERNYGSGQNAELEW